MKRWLFVVITVIVTGPVANAGEWYAGVDVGYVEHQFTPAYSFVSGREDISYENESYGVEARVHGGYVQKINSRLSMGYNIHASANDAEWTLNIPEPANFKYEQPYTWGVSITPTIQFSECAGLLLEAGLVQGIVGEHRVFFQVKPGPFFCHFPHGGMGKGGVFGQHRLYSLFFNGHDGPGNRTGGLVRQGA